MSSLVDFDVDDDCSELSFISDDIKHNNNNGEQDKQENNKGSLQPRQKRNTNKSHFIHPNDEDQEKQRPDRFVKQQNGLQELQKMKNKIQNKSNKIENREREAQEQLPKIEEVYLYKPGFILGDLHAYSNLYIQIRIDTEYLTRFNKEIIKRSLWGSRDSYSSNSDAAAMAIHANLTHFSDPKIKQYKALGLICKVSKARQSYTACLSNNIQTRALKGYNGHALKPEFPRWLENIGLNEDLMHYAKLMSSPHIPNQRIKTHDPEDTQTLDRKKFIPIPEYVIVYNMVNEPAYKYSLMSLGDQSEEILTSAKLIKECLYLQSDRDFYQISWNQREQEKETSGLTFRVSRVREPFQMDNEFMRDVTQVPLSEKYVDVLFPSVSWEEIQWATDFCLVKGTFPLHQIKSYQFYERQTVVL